MLGERKSVNAPSLAFRKQNKPVARQLYLEQERPHHKSLKVRLDWGLTPYQRLWLYNTVLLSGVLTDEIPLACVIIQSPIQIENLFSIGRS